MYLLPSDNYRKQLVRTREVGVTGRARAISPAKVVSSCVNMYVCARFSVTERHHHRALIVVAGHGGDQHVYNVAVEAQDRRQVEEGYVIIYMCVCCCCCNGV